jgi:hypothetical protein
MKFISLIVIILGIALTGAGVARADTRSGNPDDFHYVIHLQLRNGVLSARVPAYTLETGNAAPVYGATAKINLYDRTGSALSVTAFDPRMMADRDGFVEVSMTYQPSAVRASIIYAATQFDIDLSLSSVCNDNGTCNRNIGEDSAYCPADCPATVSAATASPVTSAATEAAPIVSTEGRPDDVSRPAFGGRVWLLLVGLGAGAGALLAGTLFHKMRRSQQSSE